MRCLQDFDASSHLSVGVDHRFGHIGSAGQKNRGQKNGGWKHFFIFCPLFFCPMAETFTTVRQRLKFILKHFPLERVNCMKSSDHISAKYFSDFYISYRRGI
jgi:hypothetical protein